MESKPWGKLRETVETLIAHVEGLPLEQFDITYGTPPPLWPVCDREWMLEFVRLDDRLRLLSEPCGVELPPRLDGRPPAVEMTRAKELFTYLSYFGQNRDKATDLWGRFVIRNHRQWADRMRRFLAQIDDAAELDKPTGKAGRVVKKSAGKYKTPDCPQCKGKRHVISSPPGIRKIKCAPCNRIWTTSRK